jgi:hypothetical protein
MDVIVGGAGIGGLAQQARAPARPRYLPEAAYPERGLATQSNSAVFFGE